MFCEKHPSVQMREVCGEPTCGKCFEEQMFREPINLSPNRPGTREMSQHITHKSMQSAALSASK